MHNMTNSYARKNKNNISQMIMYSTRETASFSSNVRSRFRIIIFNEYNSTYHKVYIMENRMFQKFTVSKTILSKKILSTVATTLLSSLAMTSHAEYYGTALFDKTGSMNVIRSADDLTRCQFGKSLLLQTIHSGIMNLDYINVKYFSSPGQLTSLSNGFVDVRGLNPFAGEGKDFYDNMEAQLDTVSCSGSTALGDAICDSITELRAQGGSSKWRVGLVTDASENASLVCKNNVPGDNSYIDNHVVPAMNASTPPVILNLSILQNSGGNVSFKSLQQNKQLENIEFDASAESASAKSVSTNALSEIELLIEAAINSGGGAIVIEDDQLCTKGCDPASQEPPTWGGGW